jgi:hypothetical protein
MKLYRSPFSTLAALFALSLVAGCSDDGAAPANTAGASGGGVPAGGSGGGSGGRESTAGSPSTGGASAGSGGSSAGSAGLGFGGGPGSGTGGQPTSGGTSAGTSGQPAGGGGSSAGTAGQSSGGSPSGGSGGGIPATWETVKFVFDQGGCFGTICHDLHENNLYMKGTDDQRYMELTTSKSKHCGDDFFVVVPGNPAKSSLPKMLREGCGTIGRMPDTCTTGTESSCIPPEYIQAIETWIANGAKR